MNQHVLISLTKEELQSMITECVNQALSSHNLHTTAPTQTAEVPITAALLTIKDMCDLFKVSKVTIHNWRKQGKLPYRKKGRRVYFVEQDVMNSMYASSILKNGRQR